MNWKEFISYLLREFRLSGNQLSQLTGITQPTINRLVTGKTAVPYPDTVKRLEQGLKIKINDRDPENITYQKLGEEEKKEDYYLPFPDATKIAYFPLLSTVYAGEPEMLHIEHHNENAYFVYDKPTHKCFALKVSGKSMETTLKDGDVVLVDMDLLPIDGDLVAVKLKNGHQYIKRYKELNYAFIQLSSDNPDFGVRLVDKNDIEVIYPVVAIQFNLRNGERKH